MGHISISELRRRLKKFMPKGVEDYMLIWAIEEANSLGHSIVEYYFSRKPDITLMFSIPYPGSNEVQVYGLRIHADKSLLGKTGINSLIEKEIKGIIVKSEDGKEVNFVCEVKSLDEGLRVIKAIIDLLHKSSLHSGRVEIIGYNTLEAV